MTEQEIQTIARKIADHVFVNGQGEKANRLVLTTDVPTHFDLGGWGKEPFIDRVAAILREELGVR